MFLRIRFCASPEVWRQSSGLWRKIKIEFLIFYSYFFGVLTSDLDFSQLFTQESTDHLLIIFTHLQLLHSLVNTLSSMISTLELNDYHWMMNKIAYWGRDDINMYMYVHDNWILQEIKHDKHSLLMMNWWDTPVQKIRDSISIKRENCNYEGLMVPKMGREGRQDNNNNNNIVLIYTARIGLKSPFTPAVGYCYYCGEILKLYWG
jgi:hypothetical protein